MIENYPWKHIRFTQFFNEDERAGLLDRIDFIKDDPKFHKIIKDHYVQLGGQDVEELQIVSKIKDCDRNDDSIHTDWKPNKKLTTVVYLSEKSVGTYFYPNPDSEKQEVEWEPSAGYSFIPAKNTFHAQPSDWEGDRKIVLYNLTTDGEV